MLVLTGLFVLVFFLMLRRLGGAGSPMAFGRSRGKMYAQEDIGITFEDVAGIDEAVEELRERGRVLAPARTVSSVGRTHSERRAVGWTARHRQNTARESHCR